MMAGRLVTQEEKEELIRQRSQSIKENANTFVESTFSERRHQRTSSGSTSAYGTLPGEETPPLEDEVFVSNSGHAIDVSEVQKLLSESSQHCVEDEECSCLCVRKRIRDKAINYYHWFLLLFKNGWWKTTLLLWYLW